MGDEAATRQDLNDFKKFLFDELSQHKADLTAQFSKASETADSVRTWHSRIPVTRRVTRLILKSSTSYRALLLPLRRKRKISLYEQLLISWRKGTAKSELQTLLRLRDGFQSRKRQKDSCGGEGRFTRTRSQQAQTQCGTILGKNSAIFFKPRALRRAKHRTEWPDICA